MRVRANPNLLVGRGHGEHAHVEGWVAHLELQQPRRLQLLQLCVGVVGAQPELGGRLGVGVGLGLGLGWGLGLGLGCLGG